MAEVAQVQRGVSEVKIRELSADDVAGYRRCLEQRYGVSADELRAKRDRCGLDFQEILLLDRFEGLEFLDS